MRELYNIIWFLETRESSNVRQAISIASTAGKEAHIFILYFPYKIYIYTSDIELHSHRYKLHVVRIRPLYLGCGNRMHAFYDIYEKSFPTEMLSHYLSHSLRKNNGYVTFKKKETK